MDLSGVVRLFNFNAKKNQRSKVIRGMIDDDDDVGPPGTKTLCARQAEGRNGYFWHMHAR